MMITTTKSSLRPSVPDLNRSQNSTALTSARTSVASLSSLAVGARVTPANETDDGTERTTIYKVNAKRRVNNNINIDDDES